MGSADGIHRVIEAAHYLVTELDREDVQFLLMGFGPEYDNLVRLRDELGMGDSSTCLDVSRAPPCFPRSAQWIGVSGDPVNSYNHHCTMNKVLEYMAVGKPQVTYDLKESRYSAGEAAHYVSEVTSQALGQAIADLLDDPARREQMGQLGQARFRSKLNWEKSVEQLEAAYAHTLGEASVRFSCGKSLYCEQASLDCAARGAELQRRSFCQ